MVCLILIFGIIGSCNNKDVIPKLPLDNVVKIKVQNDVIAYEAYEIYNGWQGTGIFIKDDLILTAGHIVENADIITIITNDGEQHIAIDWYKESEADLGVIKVITPEKEKELKFDSAKLGEGAWALGNSLGIDIVLTKGIISALNIDFEDNFFGNKNIFLTDTAANPGNSGGPIFNKNGKIVGILVGGFYNAQGMNIVIPSNICELTLNKYFAIEALKEIK